MKKRPRLVSFLVGLSVLVLLGITTDQIMQNVYDSTHTALRVNLVNGGAGGTVTSTGTSPNIAAFTSATNVGNYAGTGTSAGNVISALSAAGVATFVAAGSTNITNVTGGVFIMPNKSSTGTTLNKLVKIDTTASPATGVIATTADVNNILGVCVSGCGTTGSATILTVGQAPCVFSNSVTVGHYVIVSTGTNGDCADSGSATTFPTGVAVVGIAAETGDTSVARLVDFNTPDVASASSGPNGKGNTVQTNGTNAQITANFNGTTPAASGNGTNVTWQASNSGNTTSISAQIDPTGFKNLAYSGTLNASDVHSNTTGTTVAHRFEACGSGASGDVTMTMPASPAVGDTYTLIQRNASHNCIFSRAGSQTLDGATTATLNAGVALGKGETCVYIASNDWHCEGAGT